MSAEPDEMLNPFDRLLRTARPQVDIATLLKDEFWAEPVATWILWEVAEWWTTEDGRRLKIAEMEPSHAANVVRMLERHSPNHWRNIAMLHHLGSPWFASLSELEYQEKYGWMSEGPDEFELTMADPIAWMRRLPRVVLLTERAACTPAPDEFDLLLESL